MKLKMGKKPVLPVKRGVLNSTDKNVTIRVTKVGTPGPLWLGSPNVYVI